MIVHALYETVTGRTGERGPFYFCSNECRLRWEREISFKEERLPGMGPVAESVRYDAEEVNESLQCDLCQEEVE